MRGERKTGGSVLRCCGVSVTGGQRSEVRSRRSEVGFSLVEVTVAIGIFAFVVVGILGLLPTAMRLRAESAQETRAVLIAQEMFSSVRAAPSIREVVLRDGPGGEQRNNQQLDLTQDSFVVGYPVQTSVPYWLFRGNAEAAWKNMPNEALINDIQTLARLGKAEQVAPNLYRVTVEVRSPASLPLDKTKPVRFVSYCYSP